MERLDRFVTSKLAAGLSLRTIEWYEWIVGRYYKWCERDGRVPETADALEAYLAQLRRNGLSASTINAHYRALRVFFRWLAARKLLNAVDNPVEVIEEPRVPRRQPRYVTMAEFTRLYESIDGDRWIDLRDRVVLLILFYSGLRVGELLGLQAADIDLARCLITVNAGKGGHQRRVPCTDRLAGPLLAYYDACPPARESGLWLSDDGAGNVRGPLTIEGVRQMLRRRCKAEGMRCLNPHAFRHGYAMALLNAGMDISALSNAMGHNSVKTTEGIYARWLTGGLSREYSEAMARLDPAK